MSRPVQTDVRRTRGLQTGQILSSQSHHSQQIVKPDALKEEESRLNKKLDDTLKSLQSSFVELITSMTVADKNLAQVEMDALMMEYRADTIVKSVNTMSKLSRALQLSLLVASGQHTSEDREREVLEREIKEMQNKCFDITHRVINTGSAQVDVPLPVFDEEESDVEEQDNMTDSQPQQQPEHVEVEQQQQPVEALLQEQRQETLPQPEQQQPAAQVEEQPQQPEVQPQQPEAQPQQQGNGDQNNPVQID